MGKCVKCGREASHHYPYYSARVAGKASYESEGLFSKTTTKETTYTDIRPQTGYLCSGEGCWKIDKPTVFQAIKNSIGMSIFGLLLAAFGIYLFILVLSSPSQTGTFVTILISILMLLLFLVPAALLFKGVFSSISKYNEMPATEEFGSRIVCDLLGRKGPNGTVLLTPLEAKRMSKIR